MIWDVSSFVVCLSVFISLYLWDSYLKKGEHWLKFMMGTFTDRPKDILPRGELGPFRKRRFDYTSEKLSEFYLNL